MKKVLVFALVLVMVLAVSTAALADTFVNSPSNNAAPTVVDVTTTNADWDGEIIVTPYSERGTLPEDASEAFKAAYNSIKDAANVTELNEALATIAESLGIDVANLTVGDLFDVRATKEGMGAATITLSSETFKNFVALIHYVDGEWELVDNATVDGTEMTFTTENFSPFAVIVFTDDASDDESSSDEASSDEASSDEASSDEASSSEETSSTPGASSDAPVSSDASQSPPTGDSSVTIFVLMAVLAGAGLCFLAKSRKENA